MKEGRASVTATCVAFARAAAAVRPLTTAAHDDAALAKHLLPPLVRPLAPRGLVGQAAARVAMLGLVDHLALRTAAIDAAVEASAPVTQLVLLGAGLDTRAYRLPWLARARVFEVDHPASQAAKLARVRTLSARATEIRHVAADFMADDVGAALAAHGHDRAAPTTWILEGVTMYLPEAITRALLRVAAERSSPASVLAMTYMRPPKHPVPRPVRRVVDAWLDVLGEPLGATYAPDAVASLLDEVGLVPISDTCAVEWAARFGGSATLARPFRSERLVIARR